MSNPPFRNPFNIGDHDEEEDDFSFPVQVPHNLNTTNQPFIENHQIITPNNNNLPSSTSFSIPIHQVPHNLSNNSEHSFIENHQIITPNSSNNLPNNASLPMSDYQDLSMFLDDDHEENYPFIDQLFSPCDHTQETNNIDWQGVQAAAQGSVFLERPDETQHEPVIMTTTIFDDKDKVGVGAFEVGEGSTNKKLDHNAKERVRRKRINNTYLTLRSLLPESRRTKKRWSAPYVIDRALEYIPELQSVIEKLSLEKDNMLSVIGKKQQVLTVASTTSTDDDKKTDNNSATLTVSINEVKEGEVIIQICENKDKNDVLTILIEKLEGEGMMLVGASFICASEDRACFHIHVQMGEKPRESDYVAILHKKIISWLS